MKIIIKFSSEIVIKSRAIRIFFIKVLVNNIKVIFKKYNQAISIIKHWDYLEIIFLNDYKKIIMILTKIPGIHHFLLVKDGLFNSLNDIYEQINLIYNDKLSGKKFCVRVKYNGIDNINSKEIECYLGDKINRNIKNTYVDLTKPDMTVCIEIKNNRFFIVISRYDGLGGFPVGTQNEVLSLISGGFDSAVSSYMLIRRGCKVHYCFFNIGGVKHTFEVCRLAYYLWNQFSYSHKVKFVSIDFTEVVKEISIKIKSNYAGIVLKRMMFRIASAAASRLKISTLVTGEVLGQVSSQTLDNLRLIDDSSSNCTILRPLISYDKETIITLSRKIGTEIFSKDTSEYCAIAPKHAAAKALKQHIEFEESNFDFSILDRVIDQIYLIDIQDISLKILKDTSFLNVEVRTQINVTDIILDIRTETERKKNPLFLHQIEVQNIPFYKLSNQFCRLDQNKVYLLYCDHGIMSRLQAMYLYDKGFYNVKIYRPPIIN